MPETEPRQLNGIVGGISTQAPHLRHPGQVQDAENAVFSVEEGAGKRPGSRFQFVWTDLPTDRDIRIHEIVREANGEKYHVGYGASTLKVRTFAGTRCAIFQKAAPLAYLGTSEADSLRLVTVADTTIITSKDRAPGTKRSVEYKAVRTVRTFDQVVAMTPAAGERVEVTDSSGGIAPGFWRYFPGMGTHATLRLADTNSDWSNPTHYTALTRNPLGFTVFFSTVASTIVNATWTQATKTITQAGAFAGYTHEPNRYINITGGTGFTVGHYLITGKIDDDNITIEHAAPPANTATLDAIDIGISVTVAVAMNLQNVGDMHDIAQAFQVRMRANGAPNACVAWTTKNPDSGYFTITHPYAGASSAFPSAGAIRTPGAETLNLTTTTGHPFLATGYAAVAGSGRDDLATSEPVTRWQRVAGPGQEAAEYDAEKMPCSLVRVHAGGVWNWTDMTAKMDAFAWYRLGEANGQTAYDEVGHNHGTMPAAPVRTFPGLLAESDDGARVFNSNNKHLWLGQLDELGSKLGRPISFEARIRSNHATKGALVACGKTSDGTTQSLHVWINTTDGATDSQGRWWFRLSDRAGRKLTGNVAVNTGVTDNNAHTLAVSFDPANNGIYLWIDGVSVAVTVTENQTPSDFTATTTDTAWTFFAWDPDGDRTATNGTYLRCTADEVVIHLALFNAEIAAARHAQATNAAYSHAPTFVLKETPYNPRPSGDQNSNPVPKALAAGKPIADVALFKDRLWYLCGDTAISSQDGDFFNLWIEDPAAISDSDPIVRIAPGDQVAQLDFVQPVQRVLMAFSTSGHQFQLSALDAFTPTSAAFDLGTRYQAVPGVRPCADNTRVFFAGGGEHSGHLIEYYYTDTDILLGGNIVSSHARGLLPSSVRRIVASTGEANTVLELANDGLTIYVYRYYYDEGRQKVQSAWGKWPVDPNWPILDMSAEGDTAYFLTRGEGINVIESHSLVRPETETGMPYVAHMDRVCAVTGVFGGVNTTWALPGGLSDTTLNQLVKANGTVVSVTSSGTALSAAGNHAGAAVAGRKVRMKIKLTRHFERNRVGQAILSMIVTIRSLVIAHVNSGTYDVVARMLYRSDRRRTMTPKPPASAAGDLIETAGEFEASLNGDAAACEYSIESESPLPCTITGIEYLRTSTRRG